MKPTTPKLDPRLTVLERRESQLWWLAVLVIVLLGCAVSAVDWSSALQVGSDHPLAIALNTRWMRLALILSVLATSAYFRDSARKLRRTNNQLIAHLGERTEELERKNAEIALLKDLSDQMMGLMDLPKALDLALDTAVEITGADAASIMLRDADSDVLRVVAARGLPQEVVGQACVRLGEGVSGSVAESGDAVILNSDEPGGELRERARRLDELVSAIIVPIQVESKVRGVINVSRRRGGRPFTEDDLRVVSTLANQSALVLWKIELWEDLQQQVARLESALDRLRQTQAELVQSEKLASIGQLAGGMAHEINNPLQVIRGHVELLLQTEQSSADYVKHLTTVLDQVDRIASIVSALLRFSRRQPADEQAPVSVDDAVRQAITLMENQLASDGVRLILDLNCPDVEMIGSQVRIEQVFMNLIVNAYQAMRPTGGELRIRSEAKGEKIVVTVADTGPGISPEHLPHIFEPFFTTKPEGEGTGLGLSVSYGIVRSHEGELEVESEVGRGAKFTVIFPRSQTSLSEAA